MSRCPTSSRATTRATPTRTTRAPPVAVVLCCVCCCCCPRCAPSGCTFVVPDPCVGAFFRVDMWVGGGAVCTAAGGLLGFGPVVHVVGRRFASAHGSGAVPPAAAVDFSRGLAGPGCAAGRFCSVSASRRNQTRPAAVSGCLVWAGWCFGVWGGWVKVAFLFASLAMANEAARFHWLRCLVGGSLFCLLLASVVARLLVLVSVSSLPLFSLVLCVSGFCLGGGGGGGAWWWWSLWRADFANAAAGRHGGSRAPAGRCLNSIRVACATASRDVPPYASKNGTGREAGSGWAPRDERGVSTCLCSCSSSLIKVLK